MSFCYQQRWTGHSGNKNNMVFSTTHLRRLDLKGMGWRKVKLSNLTPERKAKLKTKNEKAPPPPPLQTLRSTSPLDIKQPN